MFKRLNHKQRPDICRHCGYEWADDKLQMRLNCPKAPCYSPAMIKTKAKRERLQRLEFVALLWLDFILICFVIWVIGFLRMPNTF